MSTENLNYENRFQIVFASETYSHLTKNITAITSPDITIGHTIQSTSIRNIYIPGNSIEFGDITITNLLDEDYMNYKSYIQWLNRLRGFDSIDLTRDVIDADIILLNGKHNPFLQISLKDIYPYSISDIPFNYQISDLDPIIFTVTFKINGFIME